jgi:anti-sigma B factor antagonist
VTHLSLETSHTGGTAVIALRGELDVAGAAVLEEELARLEPDPPDAVVLDLRDLEFMDSSGLHAIATRAIAAQERGQRFALVPGAAQVMRVFDITRMRERLDFVDAPGELGPA